MMSVPPNPNLPDAFAKDSKAEREGILPKLSWRAALVMLTIVLLLTLAVITLFLTASH